MSPEETPQLSPDLTRDSRSRGKLRFLLARRPTILPVLSPPSFRLSLHVTRITSALSSNPSLPESRVRVEWPLSLFLIHDDDDDDCQALFRPSNSSPFRCADSRDMQSSSPRRGSLLAQTLGRVCRPTPFPAIPPASRTAILKGGYRRGPPLRPGATVNTDTAPGIFRVHKHLAAFSAPVNAEALPRQPPPLVDGVAVVRPGKRDIIFSV